MGFFGGGGNDQYDRVAELQEEQIRNNKAELEAKKQSLYQTRLDIIKGQGAQSWTPNMGTKAPSNSRANEALNKYPFNRARFQH
jgi:hypothetical protein